MGWHTDSKHSLAGNYLPNSNSQSINTPVLIFSVGSTRELGIRRRLTTVSPKGFRCWETEEVSTKTIVLEQGSLFLIHPDD